MPLSEILGLCCSVVKIVIRVYRLTFFFKYARNSTIRRLEFRFEPSFISDGGVTSTDSKTFLRISPAIPESAALQDAWQ
jgi:hypothetical protein